MERKITPEYMKVKIKMKKGRFFAKLAKIPQVLPHCPLQKGVGVL